LALLRSAEPPILPATMPLLPESNLWVEPSEHDGSTWGYRTDPGAVYYTAANTVSTPFASHARWEFQFQPEQTTKSTRLHGAGQNRWLTGVSRRDVCGYQTSRGWDGCWLKNNIGTNGEPHHNVEAESYWTRSLRAPWRLRTTFTSLRAANETNVHSPLR